MVTLGSSKSILSYILLAVLLTNLVLADPIAGDTINVSTTLTGHLLNSTNGTIAQGDGLIVGAHGITLDCAGFNITGSSAGIGVNINGFDNLTIRNCVVQNFAVGMSLSNGEGNLYQNNIIRLSGATTVFPISNVRRTTFLGNAFLGTPVELRLTNSDDIIVKNNVVTTPLNITISGGNVTAINNTPTNVSATGATVSISNQVVNSFVLTGTRLSYENSQGKVEYLNPITATGNDLSQAIRITSNLVDINASANPGLNAQANVTLFNVPLLFNPIVFRNGTVCPGAVCQPISFILNNYTFNVTGFSNYSMNERLDQFENDNQMQNATVVPTTGAITVHSLLPAADVDFVTFNVTRGLPYRVETFDLKPSGANTIVTIFNATGFQVAQDDNSGNGSLASRVIFTPLQDGQYFAQIRDVANLPNGTYNVTVTELKDNFEDDNNASTAKVFPLGATQSHSLNPVNDTDFMNFTALNTSAYAIETFELRPGTNTIIRVYNSTNFQNPIAQASNTIIFQPNVTGTYFVEVRDVNPLVQGAYFINITQLSLDAFEDDDNRTKAKRVQINGSLTQHNFLPTNDEDWIAFNVSNGFQYRVQTFDLQNRSGVKANTNITIFNEAGIVRGFDDNSGNETGASLAIFTALETQTYYAQIQEVNGNARLGYNVSVLALPDAFENGSNAGNASTLNLGVNQAHNFIPGTESDFVRFTLLPGPNYLISTGNLALGSDTFIRLLDRDGVTTLATNDNFNATSLTSFINFTPSFPGTYFLQITQQNNVFGGTYTVRVDQTGCVFADNVTLNQNQSLCALPATRIITGPIVLNATRGLLECNNVTLIGDRSFPALIINAHNVTINNCRLQNFTDAILSVNGNGAIVRNSYFDNNNHSATLGQGTMRIIDSIAANESEYDINLSVNSANLSLTNVVFDGSFRPNGRYATNSILNVYTYLNVTLRNQTTPVGLPFANVIGVDAFNRQRFNVSTFADGSTGRITVPVFDRFGVLEINSTPYNIWGVAPQFKTAIQTYTGAVQTMQINMTAGVGPRFDNITPPQGAFVVPLALGKQLFNVTASDADGDVLTYQWRVNGTLQNVTGTQFTLNYNTTRDALVELDVRDDIHLLRATWIMRVRSGPTSTLFTGTFNNLTNLENVSGLIIERAGVGRIEYMQPMNLTNVADLDNHIIINNGTIAVDTGFYPQLNRPARVTMFNLPFPSLPPIFLNTQYGVTTGNVTCQSFICTSSQYGANTLTFNVTQFGTFFLFLQPNATPPTPPTPPTNSTNTTNPGPQASTEISLGDLTLGDDRTERLTRIKQEFTIFNNGQNDLTGFGFTNSLTGQYQVALELPTMIAAGTSGLANITLTIPVTHNAVNDLCEPTAVQAGLLTITANGGTIASNQAKIFVQAENKLDIKDSIIRVDDDEENAEDGDSIEVEPDMNLVLEVEVENLFEEDDNDANRTKDMDFDEVTLEVETDSDDVDIDDDDDISGLGPEEEDTLEVEIDMDEEAEDGDHDIDIMICGVDENGAKHGERFDVTLEINKESHEIVMPKVTLSNSVLSCEDPRATVDVELKNKGKNDEDEVFVSVQSADLGILQELKDIRLDENDGTLRHIDFRIPDTAKAGEYQLLVEAGYEGKGSDSQTVSFRVEPCTTVQNKTVTTPVKNTREDALSLIGLDASGRQDPKERVPSERVHSDLTDNQKVMVALAGTILFFLACIIGLLLVM